MRINFSTWLGLGLLVELDDQPFPCGEADDKEGWVRFMRLHDGKCLRDDSGDPLLDEKSGRVVFLSVERTTEGERVVGRLDDVSKWTAHAEMIRKRIMDTFRDDPATSERAVRSYDAELERQLAMV